MNAEKKTVILPARNLTFTIIGPEFLMIDFSKVHQNNFFFLVFSSHYEGGSHHISHLIKCSSPSIKCFIIHKTEKFYEPEYAETVKSKKKETVSPGFVFDFDFFAVFLLSFASETTK